MRIAIIHDWLYTLGGAERVLASMLRCFPEAHVHCLFDVLSKEDRDVLGLRTSRTSFLQRAPGIARHHRNYLPLMTLAIEQFDLGGYDLIISSSYAVAKGVLTGPNQLHVSYVHSPMRYAWDLQHEYLRESGKDRGVKGWTARLLLHRIRLWDVRTANGVDAYVANSHFVARRIMKIYGKESTVIWPPVAVPSQVTGAARRDFFLTVSRLVPHKNVHRIVDAFRLLPELRLIVVGDGPERDRLRARAGANVSFVGFVGSHELRRLMREARAVITAAEEDFGIVPVEAQGEGTPVVALGRGGACETVVTTGCAPTGVFFDSPESGAIAAAINEYLLQEQRFCRQACHRNALRFSEARFEKEFISFVADHYAEFRTARKSGLANTVQSTGSVVASSSLAGAVLADALVPVGAQRVGKL
jgi:glycosyltransferase involved in cell wall biosynthesis